MEKNNVQNLISGLYDEVDSNQMLSKVFSLFDDSKDVLIVMDDEKYFGILTQKQIRANIDMSKTKVKTLTIKAPKVYPDMDLGEVSKLMFESDIYHLPVFKRKDKEELIGVIKVDDIIREGLNLLHDESVEHIYTKDMVYVDAEDELSKVLVLLREHSISRIPVKSKEEIVGVISRRDILEKILIPHDRAGFGQKLDRTNKILDIKVKELISDRVVSASKKDNISVCFKMMLENNISSIIIKEGGIVTKKDILEKISYDLNKQDSEVFIQLSSKIQVDKEGILAEVVDFVKKHKDIGPGYIYVHITKQREKNSFGRLIHLRLRVRCKEQYDVSSESFGDIQATKDALRKLKFRMLKQNKKHYNDDDLLEYTNISAL